MTEQSPLITSLYDSVVDGDREATKRGVSAALEAGLPASVILQNGLIAAMQEVGKRFECGDYFVPEMMVSARAMQAGLALLKPHLVQSQVQPIGRVIAGTVRGDLHDIGKNLVCMMLEGAGFEIHDLGVDVPPEKFAEAVRTTDARIVVLSALLTTTMPNMQATIEHLNQTGLRSRVKIMVGGAPITESYARQIGADGYSSDASSAVQLAKSLVGAA